MLTIFNLQTEKDLLQIKECITKKDIEAIKEIAHRMLTMFRQVRAKNVIPILEKMEHYVEIHAVDEVTSKNVHINQKEEMQKDFEKLTINIRDLQNALRKRKL